MWIVAVGKSVADGDVRNAGNGDEITRFGTGGRHPVESLGAQQLGDPDRPDRSVLPAPRHRLAFVQPAGPSPVDVPARVEQTDARGNVNVLWPQGPATVTPADAVG